MIKIANWGRVTDRKRSFKLQMMAAKEENTQLLSAINVILIIGGIFVLTMVFCNSRLFVNLSKAHCMEHRCALGHQPIMSSMLLARRS